MRALFSRNFLVQRTRAGEECLSSILSFVSRGQMTLRVSFADSFVRSLGNGAFDRGVAVVAARGLFEMVSRIDEYGRLIVAWLVSEPAARLTEESCERQANPWLCAARHYHCKRARWRHTDPKINPAGSIG